MNGMENNDRKRSCDPKKFDKNGISVHNRVTYHFKGNVMLIQNHIRTWVFK